MRAGIRIGLCVALALGAVSTPASAPAAVAATQVAEYQAPVLPGVAHLSPALQSILTPSRLCGPPTTGPTADGQPVVVSLPPAPTFTVGAMPQKWWTQPPVASTAWRLWFWAVWWARGAGHRAYVAKQPASLRAIVTQALTFYRANPDPGTPTLGWAEGEAQRRLETMNCLYALTKDPRLPPVMAKDVAVQLSSRYYGPPRYMVHNHGVMANTRMIVAGLLTGTGSWIQVARRRLASEVGQAFTSAGVTHEQSTGYHQEIQGMWQQVADLLAAVDPRDPAAVAARSAVLKAAKVSGWFTEPDGYLVQLGDTERKKGMPPSASMKPGLFRDDASGMLATRWSFSSPLTTYFTARYGSARRAHGHFDHGSITWSTGGARVLTDQGYLGYDPRFPLDPWHRRPDAHNVAAPSKRPLNTGGVGVMTKALFGPVATVTMADTLFGVQHVRTVLVADSTHTLVVNDTMPRGYGVEQWWHLDPSWRLVQGAAKATTLIFRNTRGQTLRVTASGGTVSSVTRGATRPFSGWLMMDQNNLTAAPQFRFSAPGRSLKTTFTLT